MAMPALCRASPLPTRVPPGRAKSESSQAFRAVVGNRDAGNLLQRAVCVGCVSHQLRGVPVDLVEIGTVGRNPVIARSTADVATQAPEGAIAGDVGACRILGDCDLGAIDIESGDVAVPENRGIQKSVIR